MKKLKFLLRTGFLVGMVLLPLCGSAKIVVEPVLPTTEDEIRVTVSGNFGNPCFEIFASHTVEGGLIGVTVAISQSPGFCIQVVTPWSVTETVGQLPAGSYDVTASINASCCFPCADPPCEELVSFSVLESPPDPQECGGIAGLSCEAGEFCMTGLGQCCCDFVGVCTQSRQGCPRNYDPVCGCDGQTYSNACEAAGARVSIDSEGPCEMTCEAPCPPGEECFSVSGVLVSGVECILMQSDLGGSFIVDSTGFELGQRVSVTGCLDPDCISFCQEGNGCIDGELVPEPSGSAAMLTALSTLLLLRHCANRRCRA